MNPSELSNIQQTQEQETQQEESERKKLHALFDRSRFFRHAKKQASPEIHLTERDMKILTLVHTYRVLDTETLKKLTNHQASDTKFRRRLRMLWRAEYLDRPKEALYLKITRQEPCLLWALGRKGYEVLAPGLGLPLDNYQARRMKQRNDEMKFFYISHTLGLNRFHGTLELATQNHEKVRLHFWNQQNLKAHVIPPSHQLTLFQVPEKTLTLIPDGFFALEFYQEPPPNKAHYFVEYDNGTTPLPRWTLKKGLGYAEYYRQDLQSKLRGFKTFNVLIIAPTPTRKENMRRAIAQWLESAKHRGTTYPDLWLFTDKTQYHLDEPQKVLGTIWQAATSDEKRSLLD